MMGVDSPLRVGALPPLKLLRLTDVISFDAQRLHYVLCKIASMEASLAAVEKSRGGGKVTLTFDQPGRGVTSSNFSRGVLGEIEALGLSSCIPAARRLKEYAEKNSHTPPDGVEYLRELFRQLRVAIYDALEEPRLLAIELRHARLFEPEGRPFGQKVFDAFPEARDEIEEAGKCLALGRNKACVFHLMLAMEVALRELGKKLEVTLINKNGKPLTWLVIINNMNPKIVALPDSKNKARLLSVSAMLHSVGNAWRNPTMHPARHYDGMQAESVYEAVRGLMREVADVL